MDRFQLSTRAWRNGAKALSGLVVAETSLHALFELPRAVHFVSASTPLGPSAATAVLVALYGTQLAAVVLLHVPTVTVRRRVLLWLYALLCAASVVEATVGAASGDRNAFARSALLTLAFAKEAAIASHATRAMASGGGGLLSARPSLIDAVVAELRQRATRYRLASNCTLAALGVVAHGAVTHESMWSASTLTRELSRAQTARTTAIVALLASLGAEDLSTIGRRKAL
jgi:hypothetical protein